MRWEYFGTAAASVGIGITMVLALPPPWWPDMPSWMVRAGLILAHRGHRALLRGVCRRASRRPRAAGFGMATRLRPVSVILRLPRLLNS
jgi:hypothetical protein